MRISGIKTKIYRIFHPGKPGFFHTTTLLLKISIAQLNYHIGNFEGNIAQMVDAIDQARREGADLICFSELATTGYPPRDFLEFEDFIDLSYQAVDHLKPYSQDIAIVLGSPRHNPVAEGKDLYNSALVLYQGKIVFTQHKTLLPTYDIFDEYRYFQPASAWKVWEFKGHKIALTICEDIWNVGNENPMYTVCPLDEMMSYEPDFVLNLSASPFDYTSARRRIEVVKANVERYSLPIFYVNHCGAQTEILFDGGSLVMNQDGVLVDEMPYFVPQIRTYQLQEVRQTTEVRDQPKDKMELVRQGLVMGIRDYFRKLGFGQAIIGLSGGLDSALTCVLAVEALGADNVRVLLLPGPFSSDHSVNDARQLAQNLDIQYDIVPINDAYQAITGSLAPVFKDQNFGLTEENIQARIRGLFLMALSNKTGHILLNTSNKSEAAVGYGTLYGDMAGGISVIGDLYKTEVFELARHINRHREIIPTNTITKPPSAELRPDQKDSDSLPEYDVLDVVLYQYIEQTRSPEDIIEQGFDPALVRRICRLVNINEFKRYQAPPVLRISPKAFGMGRRMPIVGKYLS